MSLRAHIGKMSRAQTGPFPRSMSGQKQSNLGKEVRDEISAEIDVAVSKPGSILQKVLLRWMRG